MADRLDGNFEEILPDGKLPGDLMVSILLKLPVKSLLKFKAVCKPWRLLISSPLFIKMHLHEKSISAQDSIFLAVWSSGAEYYALLTDNCCKSHVVSRMTLPVPPKKSEVIQMLDSCNGLVCLGRSRPGKFMGIILWNPATRTYRSVEMTLKPRFSSVKSAGIGYVKATNDYKVVGLTRDSTYRQMFVYALSSNSWKKLDYDCSDFVVEFAPPVTVNGRMHWMTSSSCGSKNLIAAFDVANEVISRSMVPDNHGHVSKITRQIVTIRGCLAILVSHLLEDKDIEVWIMTEYGIQGSWAKQFSVDAIPCLFPVHPLSWKDGELLFRYNKDGHITLMSYDPIRKTKKCYSRIKPYCMFRVFSYAESLTSFEGVQRSSHSVH